MFACALDTAKKYINIVSFNLNCSTSNLKETRHVHFLSRGWQAPASACLAQPLNDESRRALVKQLESLPPRTKWTEQHDAVNQMLRKVLILIASQPEFQMG